MNFKNNILSSSKIILTITALCLFVLVCAAFIIPMGAAFSPLFNHSVAENFAGDSSMKNFFSAALLKTTAFTLEVALGSTLIALLAGIPAAFFTSHYRFPGRNFLLSLSSVPFCIPALIIALGFVSFFGMNGTMNRFLKYITGMKNPPLTFLYSFTGIIIAQGFYNFPLIMRTVNDYWERLPKDEADAARLLGAGEGKVFFSITIYQLLPAVISSAIPVFLYCFFSFIIVLLFGAVGCSTLEVEIYQAAKIGLDFQKAAAYGLVETLCAFGIVFLYSAAEQNASRNRSTSVLPEQNSRKKLFNVSKQDNQYVSQGTKIGESTGAVALFCIIFFFFLAPLFSILTAGFFPSDHGYHGTFTIDIFKKIIASKGFLISLKNTIQTAFLTGLFSVTAAFVYSCILRRNEIYGKSLMLRTIPILPMAVSSVVTGFGMTILIRRGSPLILVMAQTALNWPLAFRQIYPAINKIDIETDEAALLLSKNPLDILFRIYLPSAVRNILSAFGFCFAVSCGDTTLPLLLSIRNFDTLSLYTYRLAGSYRLTEACVCGAILGIICAFVFAAADKVKKIRTDK